MGNPGIPRQTGSWAPRREANGLPTADGQDQVVTGGTDMRLPSSDQVALSGSREQPCMVVGS